MYENGKMRPIEIIPRGEKVEIKENDEEGRVNGE
jgi:hypothetical protein